MLFRITLGDWLGKGHDIKEDFLYDCNRPAGFARTGRRP